MFRPASELAGLVRAGDLSARELVQCSLDRIEELDPTLNAFVEVDAERALASADEIAPGDQRPFAGVPIAIKNNRPVQGLRLTFGCSLMADYTSDYDHNVTRRLRAAGFVIVGTTTLPEYGILPTTEARLFGPTRNPWDLQRTPGGSSGGADPGRLRIAATTLPPVPEAVVDPICAQAVREAAEILGSLGHEVEELDPPWQEDGLRELFGAVFSSHVALSIAYSGMVAGRD